MQVMLALGYISDDDGKFINTEEYGIPWEDEPLSTAEREVNKILGAMGVFISTTHAKLYIESGDEKVCIAKFKKGSDWSGHPFWELSDFQEK